MSRWGEAVWADLEFRGIDARDLWRRRDWVNLLNLIDHLPSHSFYKEAQALDPDVAAAYLDEVGEQAGEEDANYERFSEFTPEVRQLVALRDGVEQLTRAVIASAGVKPGPFKAAQRPEGALAKVKEARRRARHRWLSQRLIPQDPPSA